MNLFQEFVKLFKEHGLEWFQRYYSVYPGVVSDVNDPEKRGRIKVVCPTVLGPDRVLAQWAEPIDMRMAGVGYGEFFPPVKSKDVVHVMFENGDINYPVYMGGYYARGELAPDFTSSYGNVRGWVFKSGNKILIDETSGAEKITFQHKSGSKAVFNPDGSVLIQDASGAESVTLAKGNVTVNSGGGVTVNAGGDVNIKAGGDANVTASGNAAVKASKITLNGSAGEVLTTETDPVVDLITGARTTGVPTVSAGG